MICVPETFPDAFAQPPVGHKLGPLFAARIAQTPEFLYGIDAAPRTQAFIPKKNLLT
jgi:hypothetical protein